MHIELIVNNAEKIEPLLAQMEVVNFMQHTKLHTV